MTDQYFSDVVALLHFEGTDGTQVFTDSSNTPNTWTAFGSADVLDDAQFRFGSSSLIVGQAGVRVGNVTDFDFGLDDFTWECWHRPTGINNYQYLFSSSDGSGAVGCNVEYGTSRPNWHCSINGHTLFTNGGSNPSVNVWHHIAVTRASGVFRLFMDGVQQGTDNGALSAQSFTNSRNFNVGSTDGGGAVTGHIDDVRITKGVARYTANFTPPTDSFPDSATPPVVDTSQLAHGQCRLALDGSDLKLSRYDGKWLIIDQSSEEIPSAGVTLSSAGLTANTIYYVYAAMSGGSMVLEASTTGHSSDGDTGVEIETGNSARTLVGMARSDGSGNWQGGPLTVSYFNRRPLSGAKFVSGQQTTSSPYTEISSSLRSGFVTWGHVDAMLTSIVKNSSVTDDVLTSIGVDSTSAKSSLASNSQLQNADDLVQQSAFIRADLAEGYHYVTGLYGVSGGTGFADNCSLQLTVEG